jgi:dTDP-glucose 4,6-dehydratase
MVNILITGGAGFIGHHLVEHILKNTDWNITVLDRLESGNLNRLAEIDLQNRVKFQFHDLKAEFNPLLTSQLGEFDYILHLAAATHVDRSITNPLSFVMDNVVSTCNLLNYAKNVGCKKFLYFSTDEVFGPAPDEIKYKEWDRYNSGNPYAATKAGAEELCLAYANTYKMPIFITHTMNVFGERQDPEKFIPSTINKIIKGEIVSIHSNSDKTKSGSRFYIHARNVSDGILFLLDKSESGEKYNIVGEKEFSNLELAQQISNIIDKPLNYEMVDFHSSRPGHDLRYALDGTRMEKMGWLRKLEVEKSLEKMVLWTLQHRQWLPR